MERVPLERGPLKVIVAGVPVSFSSVQSDPFGNVWLIDSTKYNVYFISLSELELTKRRCENAKRVECGDQKQVLCIFFRELSQTVYLSFIHFTDGSLLVLRGAGEDLMGVVCETNLNLPISNAILMPISGERGNFLQTVCCVEMGDCTEIVCLEMTLVTTNEVAVRDINANGLFRLEGRLFAVHGFLYDDRSYVLTLTSTGLVDIWDMEAGCEASKLFTPISWNQAEYGNMMCSTMVENQLWIGTSKGHIVLFTMTMDEPALEPTLLSDSTGTAVVSLGPGEEGMWSLSAASHVSVWGWGTTQLRGEGIIDCATPAHKGTLFPLSRWCLGPSVSELGVLSEVCPPPCSPGEPLEWCRVFFSVLKDEHTPNAHLNETLERLGDYFEVDARDILATFRSAKVEEERLKTINRSHVDTIETFLGSLNAHTNLEWTSLDDVVHFFTYLVDHSFDFPSLSFKTKEDPKLTLLEKEKNDLLNTFQAIEKDRTALQAEIQRLQLAVSSRDQTNELLSRSLKSAKKAAEVTVNDTSHLLALESKIHQLTEQIQRLSEDLETSRLREDKLSSTAEGLKRAKMLLQEEGVKNRFVIKELDDTQRSVLEQVKLVTTCLYVNSHCSECEQGKQAILGLLNFIEKRIQCQQKLVDQLNQSFERRCTSLV